MPKYICDDGFCAVEMEAETPAAAARQYVETGDWGDWEGGTIQVYVSTLDGREEATIPVEWIPLWKRNNLSND